MRERNRLLLLTLIMSGIAVVGVVIALVTLHQAAFELQQRRLREIVLSRALIIEAIAAHDLRWQKAHHPGSDVERRAFEATLGQIRRAHEGFTGFGQTGEFTMAQRSGDQIVFLLRQRHSELQTHTSVAVSSALAEPMRRALAGRAGAMVGQDYRGEQVVAAYQPVPVHGIGLVAKVDLAEVRRPFIRAGLLALGFVISIIVLGTAMFARIGRPIIARLETQTHQLEQAGAERRGAQDALRRSERLLTWAIERMPVPVIIAAAPDVTISHCNQAAADLHGDPTARPEGATLDRLLGVWPVVHPDGTPYDPAELPLGRAVLRGDETRDLELIVRRPDGDRWVSASAAPLRDERGVIVAGIVVFPDVTERKQTLAAVEAARTFLDTVVDMSPFAMWISDRAGTVFRTNRALREALNLTDDQILGRYRVLDDANLERQGVMPMVRAVFERLEPARFRIQWEAQHAGDAEFAGARDLHLDVAMFPIVDHEGALEHVVCQWVDLSARVRAEGELRELSSSLERRVRARTAELEAANRELEGFAYSVSHDLRAPLRAISGFAQLIVARHREELQERGRHYVDNIVEASGQMSRLIEDLLRHARLGQDGVTLGPIQVGPVLDRVLETLAERIRACGATVELADGLPVVWASETLLEQIVLNLIDNALKYQRPGVAPVIQLAWSARDERVFIDVVDNGIGIDQRFHETIFRVFERLHSDEAYPGTGIGLALVAKAAALLHGRVWVESAPGQGSTFRVSLGQARPGQARA